MANVLAKGSVRCGETRAGGHFPRAQGRGNGSERTKCFGAAFGFVFWRVDKLEGRHLETHSHSQLKRARAPRSEDLVRAVRGLAERGAGQVAAIAYEVHFVV
jgi:hypothetical protein